MYRFLKRSFGRFQETEFSATLDKGLWCFKFAESKYFVPGGTQVHAKRRKIGIR